MTRVHRPSTHLPCGCRIVPGDVTAGDVVVRRCDHGRWAGIVRPSTIVDGLLLIDWQPELVAA